MHLHTGWFLHWSSLIFMNEKPKVKEMIYTEEKNILEGKTKKNWHPGSKRHITLSI